MTSTLFTVSATRRAALLLAAAFLPLWLAGCFHDGDGDGGGNIVPRNIDFCRLQTPETIDAIENSVVTVFGRVFSAGVTDMSRGNDPDPAIIGAVGAGPVGSDPATDPGWTWFEGAPDAGYTAPVFEASYDQYQAPLTVPGPAGDYDFAFRFSGDAGATFTYCDTGLGTADGYDPADAGQLTSTAALLFREYVDGPGSDKAVEIYGASAGTVDLSVCAVNIYANASAVATSSVSLGAAGTLAPGNLHVVCNVGAAASILGACDTQSANLNYDGNDAVELACGGRTLDVIGQIGFNPGFEWAGGGVGTANETMLRDCLVAVGDSDGSDAFDPSAEWTSTGIPDYTNLGIDHCP